MKKTILIVLALVFIAGAGTAYYLYNKPVASLRDQAAEEEIASQALFTAFSEDEAQANQKYSGKIIHVEGEVLEVMKNSDNSTTLLLDGGDPIFGVKCRIDPGDEPETLPEGGESVSLKGLCIGMNADVELNQCIILSNQAS